MHPGWGFKRKRLWSSFCDYSRKEIYSFSLSFFALTYLFVALVPRIFSFYLCTWWNSSPSFAGCSSGHAQQRVFNHLFRVARQLVSSRFSHINQIHNHSQNLHRHLLTFDFRLYACLIHRLHFLLNLPSFKKNTLKNNNIFCKNFWILNNKSTRLHLLKSSFSAELCQLSFVFLLGSWDSHAITLAFLATKIGGYLQNSLMKQVRGYLVSLTLHLIPY